MIRCPKCGFDNPDDHKFCQKCGISISKTPDGVKTQDGDDSANTVITDTVIADIDTGMTEIGTDTNIDANTDIDVVITDVDKPSKAELAPSYVSEETPQSSAETTSSMASTAEVPAMESRVGESVQDSSIDRSPGEDEASGKGSPVAESSIEDSLAVEASLVASEPYAEESDLKSVLSESGEGESEEGESALRESSIEGQSVDDDIDKAVQSDDSEWLAILSLVPDSLPNEQEDQGDKSLAVVDRLQEIALTLQAEKYLDSPQRYRISECLLKIPEFFQDDGVPYLEFIVVDEQPDEPPYLDQIRSLSESLLPDKEDEDRVNSPFVPARVNFPDPSSSSTLSIDLASASMEMREPYETKPGKPDSLEPESSEPGDPTKQFEVPAIAHVYLDVQDQFYPSLPQVYDAWQSGDRSVVIVENRNNFQSLHQALQNQNTNPLQALHWFHEMTELWAVLQSKGYHQSLLDKSNLHIDEDHILCITCLHQSLTEGDRPLSDLGAFWQQLLNNSHLQRHDQMASLCNDLAHQTLSSLDELRLRLETIAIALHDEEARQREFELQPMSGNSISSTGDAAVNPSTATAVDRTSDAAAEFSVQDTAEELDDELALYPESDEAPTVVLPMRLFHLVDAGLTDIGRQRDHNEDYFSIQSEMKKQDTPAGRTFEARGLYVLCDGMGGHAAGEVASALAVSTLEDYFANAWTDRFPSRDDIRTAIYKANESIYDLNQENACYGSGRMGTTLVMMLVEDIKVAIAHVGDSRVYRFCRRTGLEQITTDHEVGQREIQRGVEPAIAYARPDAYQLTQALGPRESSFINPDIQAFEVNEDTLFLLCSDGLSDNNLLEQHCASHIEPMLSSQANLDQLLYELIDLANQRNGHDNITAIAVRMKVRPKIQSIQ